MNRGSMVDQRLSLFETMRLVASTYLKRSLWLHQLVMRWKSRTEYGLLVRPGQTKMVIEAFPRSANSFVIRMLKHANPHFPINEASICHHTHSIHSVKKGLEHDVPALVIIRDPVDCVTSYCIARSSSAPIVIRVAATEYLDFYSWLLGKLDRVVLVSFEDATRGDLNRITRALNSRYGLGLNEDIDTAKIKAEVEAELVEYSPNREDPHRYPLPTRERAEISKDLRSVVAAHPRVIEARRLYTALLDEAKTPVES